MKYVMIAIAMMFSSMALAQESCNETCKKIEQDVNTPVPAGLEDAEIIVRTKDGKETKMSANDFKVVKRKQQFKVTERVVIKTEPMPKEAIERGQALLQEYVDNAKRKNNKNLLMLGLAYDYTSLDSEIQGNTVKLYSNKGPVFDLTYFRRRLLDTNIGLGIGINTNGAPRGVVGLEF